MLDKVMRRRRRAHRLTRKVIDFLRENEDGWRIKLCPISGNKRLCGTLGFNTTNIVGCVLWESHVIIADPRSDVLSTIIHECLHVLYPDAPELLVQEMEKECVAHLTRNQAERIFFLSVLLMNVVSDPEG